jgi:hypothetical protein
LSSYAKITGYEPGSDVTEHSKIDLDQQAMEAELKEVPIDWTTAKAIYENGGNSGGYTTMTVGALAADAAKGADVLQGTVGVGKMKYAAVAGATTIIVSYKSVCKEGGLPIKTSTGCFTVAGGSITVGGVDVGAPTAVANTYRTLAGFSTAAKKKMANWEFYKPYYTYYGEVGDYANQRVLAALEKKGICSACEDVARVEIAKKDFRLHECMDVCHSRDGGCH